jgi:hypothetical protein
MYAPVPTCTNTQFLYIYTLQECDKDKDEEKNPAATTAVITALPMPLVTHNNSPIQYAAMTPQVQFATTL